MNKCEHETNIPGRLEAVLSSISRICESCGRDAGCVELIAVSKGHPPEVVREAVDAGQLLLGESKVQEAKAKLGFLPPSVRCHFIGHLQKNKIRQLLPLVEMIHGIDSLELAQAVDRVAGEDGLFPKVLLQVNVSGEASKYGFDPEVLDSAIEDLLALERIEICGLMTIAPYSDEPGDSRESFRRLREFRDGLEQAHCVPLPHLSMGMSGDYKVAIEEGSTMVRVGTAIFGPRTKRDASTKRGSEGRIRRGFDAPR